MLETLAHPTASFVTLTYSPEELPGGGSLSRLHWRQFTNGIGYRYFGCGEYGERSGRPHYHFVLFGLDPMGAEAFCGSRWRRGLIHVGLDVTAHVARYVAAYTVKKMTSDRHEFQQDYLQGREPEFARMSRRPALGWPGLQFLVRWLVTPAGQRYVAENLDVPQAIKLEGRDYPIGRTMVAKLRELADVDPACPQRRERRESLQSAIDCDELLSEERERMRFGRYDVLKARQRPQGAL